MRIALAFVALALAARTVAAHPLDLGYLRVEPRADAALAIELEVAPAVVDARRGAAAVAAATFARVAPVTDRGACAWDPDAFAVAVRTGTVAIEGRARCPAGAATLAWDLPFLAEQAPTFQVLARLGARVAIVDRATPRLAGVLAPETPPPPAFGAFVATGVRHIGAAPSEWYDADGWKLPDGLDHIAFLLALLLAGGTLRELAGVATGFTLGHSITLAIAALGIVRPPAAVIEPAIALTIVIAAIEALRARAGRRRWWIACGFGAIHGFAFAGALAELLGPAPTRGALAAPLVGFNLGVELGQLALIAVIAPALIALHRLRPRAARLAVRTMAIAIALAGGYWFAARI